MPYCSKCGIEVEDQVDYCPLCRAPIQKFTTTGVPIIPPRPHYTENEIVRVRRSTKEKRQFILVLLSVIFLAPTLMTLAVNYVLSQTITWGFVAATSIVAVWFYSCIPFLFYKKPFSMIFAYFFVSSAMQLGIDLSTRTGFWSLYLGIPITFLLFLIIGVLFFWGQKVKTKGYNIVAFILLGITAFCVGVELLINLFAYQCLSLSWSVIVLASLLPFVLMFLFFHYKSRKKLDLKKTFHL